MEGRKVSMVILDGFTNNPGDISWGPLEHYGELTVYDRSDDSNWFERAGRAEVILVNKFVLDRPKLELLDSLRCIIVLATGYNNIDIEACKVRGIKVYNAVGYGGGSVAQYVMTAILAWQMRIESHAIDVRQGGWSRCPDFSYTLYAGREIQGMQLGIVGFGKIGQTVGRKAYALGMQVAAYHSHPDRDNQPWMTMMGWEELLRTSDILSLHVPLTQATQYLINKDSLAMMPSHALLINTGRGGLVDEDALYSALKEKRIEGAVLDVLAQEPPPLGHPLFTLPNCWITPHMAWTSKEARIRLIRISGENVGHYLSGEVKNRVV
ncbi:MAG: D-2-hydroxyacid dehydrogenase [Saprospiraceae bacterium]|nr:D-2-hydroxyacid dehydrogenase [Saprospiraceae bacterium]MCB9319167.1 D-2-hydroxyacid dehydrogenase [Lewinellaceae bacterium]